MGNSKVWRCWKWCRRSSAWRGAPPWRGSACATCRARFSQDVVCSWRVPTGSLGAWSASQVCECSARTGASWPFSRRNAWTIPPWTPMVNCLVWSRIRESCRVRPCAACWARSSSPLPRSFTFFTPSGRTGTSIPRGMASRHTTSECCTARPCRARLFSPRLAGRSFRRTLFTIEPRRFWTTLLGRTLGAHAAGRAKCRTQQTATSWGIVITCSWRDLCSPRCSMFSGSRRDRRCCGSGSELRAGTILLAEGEQVVFFEVVTFLLLRVAPVKLVGRSWDLPRRRSAYSPLTVFGWCFWLLVFEDDVLMSQFSKHWCCSFGSMWVRCENVPWFKASFMNFVWWDASVFASSVWKDRRWWLYRDAKEQLPRVVFLASVGMWLCVGSGNKPISFLCFAGLGVQKTRSWSIMRNVWHESGQQPFGERSRCISCTTF